MTEWSKGNVTGRSLVLVVRDGMRLTEEDLKLVETHFSGDRVTTWRDPDMGPLDGQMSTIVLMRSRLTDDPPALKAVGYEKLPFLEDSQDVEQYAKIYGAEIFGTSTHKVGVLMSRAPNGYTVACAHCHPDDFTHTKPRKSL